MRVPWSRPEVGRTEIDAVNKVLRTGWLGMGPVTQTAEDMLRRYVGSKHCLLFNNGTSALMAAYLAYDWGPGDEILVPTYTFVATAYAFVVLGCRPILVDCDPGTMNVDPEEIRRVASQHPKARGLVFTDVGGLPCDIDGIEKVAREHNLELVEDAAEAFGGQYRGEKLGARRHLTIFSFHIAKQVTSVEGGAISTQNTELAERCERIRSHGEGDRKYIHQDIGLNLRPTDIQAAIAAAQLKRVEKFLQRRRELAQRYIDGLAPYVDFQQVPHYVTRHTWMIFQILTRISRDRARLDTHLTRAGIDTRRAFPPMHQQPYLASRFKFGSFPHADSVFDRVISLPMGNGIRDDEIDYVIEKCQRFFD